MRTARIVTGITFGVIASLALVGHAAEPVGTCARPLNVEGRPSNLGFVVIFVRDIADPEILASELGRRHGFSFDAIFTAVKGFAVSALTPQALEALRCEPTIRRIYYNQPLRTNDG